MDRLTVTQRIKIIKNLLQKWLFATTTYRALRENYGLHNHSTT